MTENEIFEKQKTLSQNNNSSSKQNILIVQNDTIKINNEESEKRSLFKFIKNQKTIEVLNKKGIIQFFPIQYQTFDFIYDGKDLIARDRTGSGKTMAFYLPIIERFRNQNMFEKRTTKFLIILPTRQLVVQVKKQIDTIKFHPQQFHVTSIYGGTDIFNQIRQLNQGVDILVATPGRLLDLLKREEIKLCNLICVCLDEADEILKQGFQQDIQKIFEFVSQHTTNKTQNLLFSATLPDWVNNISKKYLSEDRQFIDLIKYSQIKTSKTVQHFAIYSSYFNRNLIISDVVNFYSGLHGKTIIFAETKKEVNQIILNTNFKQSIQALHGDIPQKQRQITFQSFKSGNLKCLVSTNVAARGLDIPQVDLIVQLQPPKDVQTYIHRAGRTGRAGRSGKCVIFYTKTQLSLVQHIQRMAKIKLKQIGPPQPNDILKASTRDIIISLKQVNEVMLPYFNQISQQMINQQGNATIALSRALAYISGNVQKISQRSLLNSANGYITYCLHSPQPINSNGEVFNFLRSFGSQELLSNIKGMKKTGKFNAAFDVPETYKQEIQKITKVIKDQQGKAKGFTLFLAKSIQDFQNPQQVIKEQGSQQLIKEMKKRQAIKRRKDFQVFVGGLPFNVNQNQIQTFFYNKRVDCASINVLKNEKGQSKGVAFVVCLDEKSKKKALTLNGQKFGSRIIKINLASRY